MTSVIVTIHQAAGGSSDAVNLALLAVEKGEDPRSAASRLTWRDFEIFTAEVLRRNGYAVFRDIHLGKPKIQIDVIGVYDRLALVIDCKHWQSGQSSTALASAVKAQTERCRRAVRELNQKNQVDVALPVVITLLENEFSTVHGVPIVAVSKMQSFLSEIRGHLDEFTCISYPNARMH